MIRVPRRLVQESLALAPVLADHPAVRAAAGRLSMAGLIRVIMGEGIAAIRREAAGADEQVPVARKARR
jgi:hypothetical protein